ncbi:MAG: GAF domain-containing protein [Alphaproteobacteria bacterium]
MTLIRPEMKRETYRTVSQEILAVLEGEHDSIAAMTTCACLLSVAFETYFWTGFYRVDPVKPDELVVGPYQGTLGCLRIPFGKGVCGTAAASGETQVVPDVHAFPGHIACDARSRSEIVVPVRDRAGALLAVLDVDSTEPGAFDAVDRDALEPLMAAVFAR